MDITSSFVSRSVTSTANLNWVVLVDWVLIFIASILVIFYFNRLLGFIVTFIFTHVIRRRRKIKVNVQSFKVSLLAGRIFLKNVTVVTPNELIMIHTVVLTWRYWLRFVRQSQFYVQEKNLNDLNNKTLPTRFGLEIVGMEVFLYNRSFAYDQIEEFLKSESKQQHRRSASTSSHKKTKSELANDSSSGLRYRKWKSDTTSNDKELDISYNTSMNSRDVEDENCDDNEPQEVMDSTFLDFLPVEVTVTKGSLVLGNNKTPGLYVSSFSSMNGKIDATLPGSPLDYYRTHYDFKASNLKIDLRKNVSFKDVDSLERRINEIKNKKKTKNFISKISGLGKSLNKIHNLYHKTPTLKSTNKIIDDTTSTSDQDSNNDIEEWHGLDRYLTAVSSTDSEDGSGIFDYDRFKVTDTEYAKVSTILESQICKINYYYDSQGLVPSKKSSTDYVEDPDIGNKDIPPMFGVDITVFGTTIVYGPWAEKQRGSLHQVLFPPLYRDLVPFRKLTTGMRRQYVSFDLSIQCGDELVLRLPHREESKDILYLKEIETPTVRPFGWLNLKLAKGSITDISISLISTEEKGTDNKINAVFVKPEISTSINHDVLFEADEHILNASVAFPLKWNSLCDWKFENISKNANIYLLREHITLISDLLGDFSSGEPTPYELFRPFIYRFNWKMYDYEIYLNINEENIINNPLDNSINTYLTFSGSFLNLTTKIPLTSVYKKSNTVDYVLETSYFDLAIRHPTSSTFSNFMQTEVIGNANNFKLKGSYTYFSFMEIDAVDTIVMDCTCDDTTVKLYGFAIKYFMSLKENYFGDSTHFQNLLEFRDNFGKKDKTVLHEGIRLKNETDLMFSFCVNNGCLALPCHLYDCMSHIALHFDELDIDLRNNNYYMDLQANFSEVKGRYIDDCDESIIFSNTKSKVAFQPELLIEGLSIHSIRIFGLPPVEPTYFCRWNFCSNGIKIDAEPIFLNALSCAGMSFSLGHTDLENSLSLPVSPVMDILNLTFRCPIIDIKLRKLDYMFNISLFDLFFKLSDQPTPLYNSLLDLVIKNVIIEAVQNDIQILKVITSLQMKNFTQKKDAFERMKEQAMHLKRHDASFHRTPFLIPEFAKDRKYFKGIGSITSSLNLPDPPLPLTNQSVEMIIDGYPEHIKRKLSNISSAFDEDDDYSDINNFGSNLEDFEVLRNLDVDCSYDNIPITFGKTELFVSPLLAPVVVDFISSITSFNMYSILDELQADFVKFFKFKKENTVLKCKVECPLLTLKLSENFDSVDYIFLGTTDLIFAISTSEIENLKAMNLYSMVKEFNLDIINETEDTLLVTFQNILLKQSFEQKKITTFDIENISFFVEPLHAAWIIDSIFKYKSIVESAIEKWKSFQNDKHAASVELLYDLSRGGIDYTISHDPTCITKPSYIAGFSQNHIRMDGNWMIIPRLRHVLRNLPDEWIVKKNQLFKERIWEAPKSAEDDVAIIFGNWRCWDNHKTKDNFIFKKVFHVEEDVEDKLLNAVKFTLKTLKLSIYPFSNAFVADNIFFFLNEDILSDKVKDIALPLLDDPIENCLDITFKIGSLVSNFTKIGKFFNQINRIIDDTKTVLDKYKSTDEMTVGSADDSIVSLNDLPRYQAIEPTLITVNFSLNEFSYSFGIDKSILTLYGQNVNVTSSMIKAEKMMSCTLNYKNQFCAIEFYIERIPIFEFNCESHTSTLVNTGSFESGETTLFLSNDTINFNFLPETKHLTKAIAIFSDYDCQYLISFIEKFSSHKIPNSDNSSVTSNSESIFNKLNSNLFEKIKFNLSTSIKTSKINLHFELISPFFTNFEIFDPNISFKLGSFGVLTECLIGNSKLFIGSQSSRYVFEYVTFSTENLKFLVAAQNNKNIYYILTKLLIGIFRINFSNNNLVTIIHKAQSDLKISDKNLGALKKRIEKTINMFPEKVEAEQVESRGKFSFEKFGNIIHLHFDIHLNNILLNLNLNGNKIHLDCARPQIICKSYDNNLDRYLPHGSIFIPSTKISIGLNGVHGLSTIFDIQLLIEVLNPSNLDHKLQKLQINTDYCRLVLNAHIVEELIEAYGDISILLESKKVKIRSPTETNNINFEEKIDSILSFFSINILAKNICFGWLFNENDSKYSMLAPGLILGVEKTTISCAKGGGKIQSHGMYLSTARGFTSSTFYSVESEKLSDNRVYFPLFNLIYTINSDSKFFNLKAQVDGEQIDFKFQTNIFSITEPLWTSINSLQDKYLQVRQMLNRKQQREENQVTPVEDDATIISGRIFVISCVFKFSGASFFIYNSNIEINGTIPILRLQSPKLSSIFKYTYDIFAVKNHAFLFSALVSETNNKLSCLCLPVLQDIVRGFQKLMKKLNKQRKIVGSPTTSNNLDIVDLSKKIDANFSLKIEPQRLELTCEPRANIEAEAVLEEIHLIVKIDQDYLSGVLNMKGLKSELKHAYSKVISGSININHFTVSSTMSTINYEKKFSTVAKLNSVDTFINMQQRQDLDLFKNFWWPNEFTESLVIRENKSNIHERTFSSMLREVSTTTAFPWILTFIISKVTARVDLGASLGKILVNIEDFIALSTKSINWNQSLKFSFNSISLESMGRLSGLLTAKEIRITSAISWRKKNSVMKIPLVLLSFGIGNLHTKISLDYHTFFIFEIIKLSLTIYNQREDELKNDRLKNSFNIESFKVFMTALTASNFVDVYTIGLRMRQDIKMSYKQVLNDAQMSLSEKMKEACKTDEDEVSEITVPSHTFLMMIEKMKTYLDVNIDLLEVQIFPSSLLDSQAMVIKIGKQNAKFYQKTSGNNNEDINFKIENKLSLDLSDITVSLTTFKNRPNTLETISEMTANDIDEYIKFNKLSSIPDNIFAFPSLRISMLTIQNKNTNIIKYKYTCKFDGKVDIKWKIGSVYFIRQMWYSHATTLSNRLTALRIYTSDDNDLDIEEDYKKSALETVNLEDKLKDVESDKKFTYTAIVEPDIETPQLKDLGSATPPLEWFGLHRDKFPNLTHQVVVLGIQKMIEQLEIKYSKVLK